MPTPVTHALFALAGGRVAMGSKMTLHVAAAVCICAIVPDLDTVGMRLGIPYGEAWGHRGMTHSLGFAALLSLAIMLVVFRKLRLSPVRWLGLWVLLFAAGASQGVLDAMTNGGLGVAFFAPFSMERYFLPFRPIQVSPIGIRVFFSRWGLAVIRSEFLWVWLPMILLLVSAETIRSLRAKRR